MRAVYLRVTCALPARRRGYAFSDPQVRRVPDAQAVEEASGRWRGWCRAHHHVAQGVHALPLPAAVQHEPAASPNGGTKRSRMYEVPLGYELMRAEVTS